MLSAAYDGITTDEQPSLRYTLHRWRRQMNQSYAQMRETPFDVIRADLEYISIENQIRNAKESRSS